MSEKRPKMEMERQNEIRSLNMQGKLWERSLDLYRSGEGIVPIK